MTVVSRRGGASKKPALNMKLVIESFTKFRTAKNDEVAAKATHESLRDTLLPLVEAFGTAHGEHGQHQSIELPEAVDGFVRIVRRANVSELFDLDLGEKLAVKSGVLEDVQTTSITVTFAGTAAEAKLVMDAIETAKIEAMGATVTANVKVEQDKFYALHQRNRDLITAADLESCIVREIKHSFFPER